MEEILWGKSIWNDENFVQKKISGRRGQILKKRDSLAITVR